MPITEASRKGEEPYAKYRANKTEAARKVRPEDDDNKGFSEEEMRHLKLVRYLSKQYDEARKARAAFENFDISWDLFTGNVWPNRWPTWRAKITINQVRAFITFMQAIMTDNKPRIAVEPVVPGSEDAADLLRKLVDRDWDENDMQDKLSIFVLYGLIWGTSFMKITYDPFANGGQGKHAANPVVPYRIFTNRTATCIEDCEYLIEVQDMTMGWVTKLPG